MDNNITVRLHAQIKKTYYAFERYKVEATFALIYVDGLISLETIGKMLRTTDQLIQLDSDYFFIIYTYTNEENAFKASQNLLFNLDSTMNNNRSCIAIDTFDLNKSPDNVLRRLQQILSATRENSFARIENETILDSI